MSSVSNGRPMNQPYLADPLWWISQAMALCLLVLTTFSRTTKILTAKHNRDALRAIAKYTSYKWNGFCNAPVWVGTLETRGERLFAWGVLLMLCGLSAFFFVYGLAYAFLVSAAVARQPSALSLTAPMLLAMWLGGLVRQGAERLHREIVVAGARQQTAIHSPRLAALAEGELATAPSAPLQATSSRR
jgi:ABC-type uncharacterized transport system fused permease/ATPase subunit